MQLQAGELWTPTLKLFTQYWKNLFITQLVGKVTIFRLSCWTSHWKLKHNNNKH